jgi:tetraacyldisaccharide 4'-kinase
MTSGRSIESLWRDDSAAPAATRALLSAASWIYRGGRALDRGLHECGLLRRRSLPVPVASVGNLAAGGVGKTPFVGWLARELAARGCSVLVVARGYGRRPGARLNDEGEMLERAGARIVQDPNRFRAALAALRERPADLVLLDDGFQHEALARAIDVVLVDARAPFGNGRLLPRGPLREPREALARATHVFAARAELADAAAIDSLRAEVARLAPKARFGAVRFEIAALRRGERKLEPAALRGRDVVLLTGVGSPDSVAATIERLGGRVKDQLRFPDHHDFAPAELEQARVRAQALGAELVVTAKDAVKLDRLGEPERHLVLEQEVVVSEGGEELLRELAALRGS